MELKYFIAVIILDDSFQLLIAPLMELKFTKVRHRLKRKSLLIAPLMELKLITPPLL